MTSHRVVRINLKAILVTASFGSLLLYSLCSSAQDPALRLDPDSGTRSTFSGKLPDRGGQLEVSVVNPSGQPVDGARVEVRTATGSTIVMREVGHNGWVQISDLQPGFYDVVASSGMQRTSATVRLSSFMERLTLHLDSTASHDSRQNMVSANSLAVPSKARKEFEAADRLFHKNDIFAAWNHVEKALQVSPRYAPALTLRGLLEIREHRSQEAMSDLSAAVEADRGYQLAYVGLAAGHNAMGQFDEALRALDQGNTLGSSIWPAHLEAGIALLGKQDFGRALAEASQVRNLLGKDVATLHLLRGYSYVGLKDVTSAKLELRQYLKKRSTGPEADKVRAVLSRLND